MKANVTIIGKRDNSWRTSTQLSRVPCVSEKVRPKIPPHVAGGSFRMECTVVDVAHFDDGECDVLVWVDG